MKEINHYLMDENIYHRDWTLSCFSDNMATYICEKVPFLYEINIITDDDLLSPNTAMDILHFEDKIKYLNVTKYEVVTNCIKSIRYDK